MKTAISLSLLALLLPLQSFAGAGGNSGGGGDGLEIRVNEIRIDLLNWIRDDGSRSLKFPKELPDADYRKKMRAVLQPQAVVIGFVTNEQEKQAKNPEMKVELNGVKKTCRGFLSSQDQRPHVLCNTERFSGTDQSLQYQLIHHEYAGLAGVEKNVGAASDYKISMQITQFLVPVTVMKLSLSSKLVELQNGAARELYEAAEALDIGGDQGMHHGRVDLSGLRMQYIADQSYMALEQRLTIAKAPTSGVGQRNVVIQEKSGGDLSEKLSRFRHALEDVLPSTFVRTPNGWTKTIEIKSLVCTGMVAMEDDNIHDFRPNIECEITKP